MGEDPAKNDQTEVETKIRAALRSEPRLGATFHLKALTIEPDGSVILEGDVPSIAAKKLALEKVASIPGLTGIVERPVANLAAGIRYPRDTGASGNEANLRDRGLG